MQDINRRGFIAHTGLSIAALGSFGPLQALAQTSNTLTMAYNVDLPTWDPTVGPSAVNPSIQSLYKAVFAQFKDSPVELIVALGREGKQDLQINAEQYPHRAAMDAKRKTAQGQAAYRKRKWIVEAPYGWIKNVLGFRQFSLRGMEKANAEFKLVCLALNLRRMCKLRGT